MKTKHYKRKRINRSLIPNIFTLINMFLGFSAIIMLIKGNPIIAGWIILFAMGFDALDGKMARLLGVDSKFGIEFDSLADTVSFCVVPSLLVYSLYVKGLPIIIGVAISFVPLIFGTIRLARFNVIQDDPKSYYEGITTPLSTVMIVGFMLFNYQVNGGFGDPRIAIAMVIILGFLMISRIRFAKFPAFSFRAGRSNSFRLAGIIILTLSIIIWKGLVIFPLFTIYISWSVLNWLLDPNRFEDELKLEAPNEIK